MTTYLTELTKTEGFIISETVSEIVPKYKRIRKNIKITMVSSPADVVQYAKTIWTEDLDYCEAGIIILVDASHQIIGHCKITEGGRSSATVDIAKILAIALVTNASAFFFLHNHPSGNLTFSEADVKISKALKTGGNTVGVKLLDSIIISSAGYASLRSNIGW